VAPTYAPPDDLRSTYATAAPRERRKQYQDRAKISLQYDAEKWFIRPTASLLYYNLLTELSALPGYQNYCDRYDVNGGLDLGYKLRPQLVVTLGYRYGRQYQEQFPLRIDPRGLSSSSDYQRVLLGLEGKPWKWLTVAFQGGPDFRVYEPNTATHTTPVNDFHPTKPYGEASITAEITAKDTLTFKYRQWEWVASTGKLPYFDSFYDLSYRRKLCEQVFLDLGGRIQSADYNGGTIVSCQRNDLLYSVSAGVTWSLTPNLVVNASYALNLGRNAQQNVLLPVYRDFDQNVASLGVTFRF
jgi:opacity protein-like surface antigen